jgi:signal transduction histidine kinase
VESTFVPLVAYLCGAAAAAPAFLLDPWGSLARDAAQAGGCGDLDDGVNNRMKLNGRLLLGLGLVCLALVATPLTTYMLQSSRALQSAHLKYVGIAPSTALVRVLRLLQQHRGLSAGVLGGNTAFEVQRAAKQIEVDKAVEALGAVMMQADIRNEELTVAWQRAVITWRGLANAVSSRSINGKKSFAEHTALIEDHLRLLDFTLDYFGLSRHSRAYDHHLVMVLLVHTPALTEALGQVRGYGMLLLAEKRIMPANHNALIGLMTNVQRQGWYAKRELSKAVALDPKTKAEFSDIVQKSIMLTQKAVDLARTQLREAEMLSYSPASYYAVFTEAIDEQFALIDKAMVTLEGVLQARANALQNEQRTMLGVTALVAGLAVWLVTRVVRTIKQDIAALQRSTALRETIYKHSTLFSRSLEFQEVYPAFVEAVKAFLPYDRIDIVVPEGESLVAVLSISEPPMRHHQGRVWHPRVGTAVDWVLAHRTPRLMRDLTTEQGFADEAFAAREGIRATLKVPLQVGGQAVGVFVADSRTAGVYTGEHVELSRLMTEPLAVAIQNAGLYAQITHHAEALEGQVEDRTRELRAVNVQLEAVSLRKSTFLANWSHELRTPLNAILGFADLLRDQTGGPLTVKQARYTDHIQASGRYLLTLINDLLDLSKVEANKLILRPEPFAFSEALAAAVQGIQPLADTKGLTVMLNADLAPAVLTADPVRFKQILYNLLSNAVKFTPEGGRITVTARRTGRQEAGGGGEVVDIAVTDTGIGITAEDLPTLFERFRQLETTKQTQGSGLGLALTKQLVELHGGTMTAASAGPGQGSCFTVRLPLAPPASQRTGEG